MTASIMIGVPLGTFFSQWIPWSTIFYFIGLLVLLTLLYVMVWFPKQPLHPDRTSLSGTYRKNALISELNPNARGTILSWNSSAVYGGMTAATALTALILTLGSFAVAGIICAILTLLILPVMQFLVMENKTQAAQVKASAGSSSVDM